MRTALSNIFFWTESQKLKVSHSTPSILSYLPQHSFFRLFLVAVRPSLGKYSYPKVGKLYIRILCSICILKLVLFGDLLTNIYQKQLLESLVICGFFVILGLGEAVVWDDKHEKRLDNEIRPRLPYLGSTDLRPKLDEIKQALAAQGETQNGSASHGWVESDMNEVNIDNNAARVVDLSPLPPGNYNRDNMPKLSPAVQRMKDDLNAAVIRMREKNPEGTKAVFTDDGLEAGFIHFADQPKSTIDFK